MRRGLSSLATIASTAAWVGVFGTLLGLLNSFPGFTGERHHLIAVIFERLSHALVTTALGLLTALTAQCGYKYLSNEVESFETEMKNVTLELTNELVLWLKQK